jgi:acetate kinase
MGPAERQADRAILVVDVGSSSLEFSVYRVKGQVEGRDELAETARGLLDGIGLRPRFSARDLGDDRAEDRGLDASEAGDHRGVIAKEDLGAALRRSAAQYE